MMPTKRSRPTPANGVKIDLPLKKSVSPETIDKIKPRDKERLIPCDVTPNMFLVVRPSGFKSWRWQSAAKGGGKKTLGGWPAMSIKDARGAADELNDRRAAGLPLESVTEKAAQGTLRAFSEEWLETKKANGRGLRSLAEYRRQFKADVWPVCGDKPLSELTRADMDAVINPMRKRGVGALSNRVLAILRPVIKSAVAQDLIDKDITAHIDKFNEASTKSNSRALSIDELATLYVAAEDMDEAERDALRLLILTGTRRNEAMAAAIQDWDGETWTIPTPEYTDARGHTFPVSHAKNGREHPLKLGPVGRSILESRKNNGEYFFTNGPAHKYMMPNLITNARVALKSGGNDLPKWDFRAVRRGVRTAITSDDMLAAGHRFREEDGERLLNHSLGSLNATYNKNTYGRLIGEVLSAWEDLLTSRLPN